MKKLLFFGVHIPKCAGTTLLSRVEQCLPISNISQSTSIYRNYINGWDDFIQIKQHKQLKFVFGHTVHEEMLRFFGPMDKNIFLFTGLRDPADRLKSEVKYQMRLRQQQGRSELNVSEYISNIRNPMCWFLISRFPSFAGNQGTPADKAINILKNFSFCYFTENFEETTKIIFDFLEISPDAHDRNTSPEGEEIEVDLNLDNLKWDIELYDRAKSIFLSQDIKESFSKTNPDIEKFSKNPVNMAALRKFYYGASYGEYRNWKCLDEAIQKKRKIINELSAEIEFYLEKLRIEASP